MDLELRCSLHVTAVALEISYEIVNRSSVSYGLFNRIKSVRPDGVLVFSKNNAYVDVDRSMLVIQKRALEKPEGLAMAAFIPPYASLLGPMSHFRETIELATPIHVMQPFKAAMLGGQVVADVSHFVTSVSLVLGVFRLDDTCRLIAENPAHPSVFTATPGGVAVARQHLLEKTLPLPQPVETLCYRAVPWR